MDYNGKTTDTKLKTIFLRTIKAYQKYVSPFLAPSCRFSPTCSAYTYQSIERYGLIKGAARGILRLLKCHPFHPGGYDPVEK